VVRRIGTLLTAIFCLVAVLAASGPPGIWLDVPFVKQEKEGCGAASIAMVMQFWAQQQGQPASDAADNSHIQQALYSKQGHGIYASDLEQYFRQSGFRTFAFRGEFPDLKQHLEKGRPLIVALKPRAHAPLHYVVVTGLDWQQKVVLINDPAQRKLLKQQQSDFEREWSDAGKWTLLALPQSQAR
jgi:ABC-type bacteriocin/lantibiotic exporter with double-glycine peptidase domain